MKDRVSVAERWIWLFGTFLIGSCTSNTAAPDSERPGYVTGSVCATCHEKEAMSWSGSDHDLAMASATPESVLGDFDDTIFAHPGSRSRFFREGDRYFVETEGATGKTDTFEVRYTFGYRPLQQYLIELNGGRVQALTTAWDTENERWFSLLANEHVPPGDWLHWTGAGMNWNHMCADCHSTGLEKNFDLAGNTFTTTWSDIDVACESCHGPGEAHVEWAHETRVSTEEDGNKGLIVRLNEHQRVQVETCAPCHSRRRIVATNFFPGDNYLDHYMPELIEEHLYYPDGQIKDEVYVYGSFLQSRMYHEGVKCTDCHDPHSTRLRFAGNDLCTQCHFGEAYDVAEHLNHADGSPGAECVNCHMPRRTYMVVDPRSDHSFKVPRPDLTLEIGIPNACNTCHAGRSAEWARDWVVRWYGPYRSDSAAYGRIIAAGRRGDVAAEDTIISFVRSGDFPAILRATAVTLLGRYDTRNALGTIEASLTDPQPLVRVGAVRAIEGAPDQVLHHAVRPLLTDQVRAVRVEAARVLTRIAHRFSRSAQDAEAFEKALGEYRESQRAAEDRPESHVNLALIHEQLAEWDKAEAAYRTALRLDSTFVPAHLNLALLRNVRREQLRQTGGTEAARELYGRIENGLRTVLKYEPDMPQAHYALGLLLAEESAGLAEAASHLSEAARISSSDARIQYNAGLVYQHLGESERAEAHLLAAYKLDPNHADYLNALAIFYAQQKQWHRALDFTDTLMAMTSPSPELIQRRLWILDQIEPD